LAGAGWNSLYLGNHDQPRPVSRFGDDGRYRKESAKMLATWLHLHQGTPYVYQGEELGMTNVAFPDISDYRDIETLNIYRVATTERGVSHDSMMQSIYAKGRDNARTPMQWNGGAQGGFTSGTPWIALNPNHTRIHAEEALADPDSVFHHYRRLIALRRQHPVIVNGRYELLLPEHPHLYAYTRTLGDERLLVLCNFSADPQTLVLPADLPLGHTELLIGNYSDAGPADTLRPYEARVLRLHAHG
jgi:oligo-1,6-glucosidase